jgi:diadenylate cyclase
MLLGKWLHWQNVVDFIVLSTALYLALLWAKQTRALHFALMIVGFHTTSLLAERLNLTITSWVFEGASFAVIGVLLLLFQAEMQHSLLRWDSLVRLKFHLPATSGRTYDAIVAAVYAMARSKTGAMIVLTRRDPIGALVSKGVRVDAEVSQGLLEAIFRKDSPIHGGAVIIEGERLAFARVILPLTGREDVPREYGTRHRAALGLAERSDALVLAVSEERGQVVLVDGGEVHAMPDAAALRLALSNFHPKQPLSYWRRVRSFLFSNLRYRLSAVGLASVIWGISFLGGGTTVNINAPVEFDNVPSGLYVVSQNPNSVTFELHGNSWLMNPLMTNLKARIDLDGMADGLHAVKVSSNSLRLPPGVTVESVSPGFISVRLERHAVP